MNVIYKTDDRKKPLKDLRYGECFRTSDSFFIKLNMLDDLKPDEDVSVTVAELTFGAVARFNAEYLVLPVKGAFVVEEADA